MAETKWTRKRVMSPFPTTSSNFCQQRAALNRGQAPPTLHSSWSAWSTVLGARE